MKYRIGSFLVFFLNAIVSAQAAECPHVGKTIVNLTKNYEVSLKFTQHLPFVYRNGNDLIEYAPKGAIFYQPKGKTRNDSLPANTSLKIEKIVLDDRWAKTGNPAWADSMYVGFWVAPGSDMKYLELELSELPLLYDSKIAKLSCKLKPGGKRPAVDEIID